MDAQPPSDAEELDTEDPKTAQEGHERAIGKAPTPAHAIVWALRKRAEETQLTRVVAEVARADPAFAAAFVSVLVHAAARDANMANARALLGAGLATEFECRAEAHLRDARDAAFGRVDLRFDGGDVTLFVENKLYSAYGDAQLNRYLAALARLPVDRHAGLVAVTRAFPTYGEPSPEKHRGWLGSVRWSRIRDELLALSVQPPLLEQQWRIFLEVLDNDGDLGRTKMDTELVRAWARYRKGRDELEGLLEQISARALGCVQESLRRKYPRAGAPAVLSGLYRTGAKGQVIARRDQMHVWLAFRVPAIVKDAVVEMSISGTSGEPELVFRVSPWDAEERIQREEPSLRKASERLQDGGYERHRGRWERRYPAAEFLDAEDVPARLVDLLEDDLQIIVPSGILDADVKLTLERSRQGPPRLKQIPRYDD